MMKEAFFCKSMTQKLGFQDEFNSVSLSIDTTSALDVNVAGNRIYFPPENASR